MSARTYLPWDHAQTFLLPPSLKEWLPDDHLVYFMLDVVQELDLSGIVGADEGKDRRGQKAYSPMMMVGLLMYGYSTGVFSSRKLEQATYVDVAFRVLCANQQPHFTTINEFRRQHRSVFAGLFVQVLQLCQRAGLVKLGQVAVDGTKMRSNASKHKAMSHVRMQAEEKRLQAEVERLLESADDIDAQENALYGEDHRAFELPEELKRREGRLQKIREAKAALEQEAREQRARKLRKHAEQAKRTASSHPSPRYAKTMSTRAKRASDEARTFDGRDEPPAPPAPGELPWRTMDVKTDGTPKPSSQRNFTDPESGIMPSQHGFIQGYNCQAVVDAAHQIIVAADVSNQSVDNALLRPMVEQVRDNTDRLPEVVLADTGYWNPQELADVRELGVEPLVAVQREKHGATTSVTAGPPPDGLVAREQMRWRLKTPEGRARYARRKAIVEPVFGQIRVGQRFQRLSFRGLSANACEWNLVAACHNLLKLFRLSPMVAA